MERFNNIFKVLKRVNFIQIRRLTDPCGKPITKRGLILGAYDGCEPGDYTLTPSADKFDREVNGILRERLKGSGIRLGNARVFNNMGCTFDAVAVAGVGKQGVGYNACENINECRENVRIASGVGAMALQNSGMTEIMVESFSDSEAAAEGASLAVWKYQAYRNTLNRSTVSKVCLFDDPDSDGWERGVFKAEAQNVARRLEETPANIMTPTTFVQEAIELLCPCGVSVNSYDRDWLEEKKLNGFVSVARGSCEPPLMLELSYCGGAQDDKAVVILGKGTTFDSGGICLKACDTLTDGRASMAGAAVVVATLKALATLRIPINVSALVPLCENMPGGMALKPGDVVTGRAGKSIRLRDTSKEDRVILADALAYSASYKPSLVITVANLTAGIETALGGSSTGAFSTSDIVWNELSKAGAETGDRVWRMPLWNYFNSKIKGFPDVDVDNVGSGRGGEPCVGAAFLQEFAPQTDFLHLDITGSGMVSSREDSPYMREGIMSGRPTRTLVQFLYQMVCPTGHEC